MVAADLAPQTADSAAPTFELGDVPGVDPRTGEIGGALRMLGELRIFWVGVALKVCLATLFGSHFATRWFGPFVYHFVHGRFANPWEASLARGEPLAFPYGPAMLGILSVPYLPAAVVSFDPSGHLSLLLLRLPLLAADVAICVLLVRWLRIHARDVVVLYWLNPIVLYATYVHGQLDLIPTALLCIALYFAFSLRVVWAGVVFGLALATKGHLLIALPFAVVYLYRQRHAPGKWVTFAALTVVTTALLYAAPLASPAFRTMVLGSTEAKKIWAVSVAYGVPGLSLYLAPSAIMVALFRFASYRKVNRELTLMFVGALYVALVAMVPPQPGWFIWSIPFIAYLAARFARTGRYALLVLAATYLVYFFVADTATFLEAIDPVAGEGFGGRAAARLASAMPMLATGHAASIAWTGLFSATALTGLEMYRKGVRSNAIYSFREESFMIGIGGDSGAGKHTIGADVVAVMGPQLSIVNGDDDHRWERGHAMWRQYTHLDPRGNRLLQQREALAALRRGHAVRKPHYDHDAGKFTAPILLHPTEFVGIVGLHPFYLASQRQLLHLKIFVDTDEALRRSWKTARDVEKRGYTAEQVAEQIERRMSDSVKYVQPQKRYADLTLRHKGAAADVAAVNLEIELQNTLDPMSLLDALSAVPTLSVKWSADDALLRDTLSVEGTVSEAALVLLATSLIPNLDELVANPSAWQPGGRGVAQLVVLHAISVRARSHESRAEAA